MEGHVRIFIKQLVWVALYIHEENSILFIEQGYISGNSSWPNDILYIS